MVKIKHEIDEQQNKMVGHFMAKVTKADAEVKTSQNGKEYTLLTLELDIFNGFNQKIFFRLPWDAWSQNDGTKTLFQQFRESNEMTKEELGDTKGYINKEFGVAIGPSKDWEEREWRTYDKDGSLRLSLGVVAIYPYSTPQEEIEKIDEKYAKTFSLALSEIKGTTKKTQTPGFETATVEDLEF